MLTAKMKTIGYMFLWAGEADVQVSPIVLNLCLALCTLGDGQAPDRPELERLVAGLAGVEGRGWHGSEVAKVWALVPVIMVGHNFVAELTPGGVEGL